MPINIKELVVRTVVEQRPEDSREIQPLTNSGTLDQAELIAACVKEVLKQLQYLEER